MAKKKPNTFALLMQLPEKISRVVSIEIANAKAEVSGGVKKIIIAVALLVAALCILFWTIAVLLTGFIALLAEVVPLWASAFIIAGAGLLTIAILAIVAIVLFKRGKLVPVKTLARVKSDLNAAGGVKDSLDKLTPHPGQKGTDPGKDKVWQ